MPSTPSDFRRIALSLAETEERKHMNHPDFRVAGKIFATLAYPNRVSGFVLTNPEIKEVFAMVKLTPTQQEEFVASHPAAFRPVDGAFRTWPA
jgi:phenylalanyl-tRNA synthetase beta subunit